MANCRIVYSVVEGNGLKVEKENDFIIDFWQRNQPFKKPKFAVPAIRLPGHMPVEPIDEDHRERDPDWKPCIPVAVARKVGRAEVEREPGAKAAVDGEWTKLANMPHPDGRGIGVWDISKVESKAVVARRFREMGKKAHFGKVAELCFQKGSELPDGDPQKKYKGRHIFPGDQVRDEVYVQKGHVVYPSTAYLFAATYKDSSLTVSKTLLLLHCICAVSLRCNGSRNISAQTEFLKLTHLGLAALLI